MTNKTYFSRGNLAFLFVTAFLAGAIAKKVAGNHMRLGYDDPTTVVRFGELYNIDVLEQELIQRGVPGEIEEVQDHEEG